MSLNLIRRRNRSVRRRSRSRRCRLDDVNTEVSDGIVVGHIVVIRRIDVVDFVDIVLGLHKRGRDA